LAVRHKSPKVAASRVQAQLAPVAKSAIVIPFEILELVVGYVWAQTATAEEMRLARESLENDILN